jgi:hypothetical protein
LKIFGNQNVGVELTELSPTLNFNFFKLKVFGDQNVGVDLT